MARRILLLVLLQVTMLVLASPVDVAPNVRSAMSKLQCMDRSSCSRNPRAKVVDCHFSVRNETRNVNGTPRTMQLVNGQFPGPCIQAMLGDRIKVRVTNELGKAGHSAQNVSLHWHGLHLKDSPIYDGTPLTQCPLKEGSSMTYDVPADTAGTHMWHSHYKLSLLDGLWGPLVVHDDNDPYLNLYEEERIISVTDFANETAVEQFAHWKEFENAYYYQRVPGFDPIYNPYNGGWYIPSPANGGHGDYYNWTYGIDGALIGVIPWVGGLINGKTLNHSSPEVVQVQSGKTYRIRILSPSAFYPLEVSIDGHRFDLIAADGSSVVKTGPYDYLNIHGGERYDILVNATGKPGDRYWIRARTQEKNRPWHQILAVLSYGDNKPKPLPSTSLYKGNTTGTRYVNCFHDIGPDCIASSQLTAHPHEVKAVPDADVNVNLHLKFIHGPLINGIRFAEPETPPIFSKGSTKLPGVWECPANVTYDGCASQFGCNCTQVVNLQYNQQVRLTLDNLWPTTETGVTGVHPFHLHGHKFALLGQGYNGPYTGQALNQVNPSWRDDVIIPAGGWAVLQFTADNPGEWMGHCHMEVSRVCRLCIRSRVADRDRLYAVQHHLNDGMSVIFSEAIDRLADLKPPADFPYCHEWDSTSYEGTEVSEPDFEANEPVF